MKQPTTTEKEDKPMSSTNQPTTTEETPIVDFGHYMGPSTEDQPIDDQETIRQSHIRVDLNKPYWQFVFQYLHEDGSPLGAVIHYQGRWFRYVIWEME